MGRPKPLLEWGGVPLVRYQVEQLRTAGAQEIVVVVGHRAEEVVAALAGTPCRTVLNPRYREGRATSLAAGARALWAAEAVVVLNVDQPRPASLLRRLLEEQRAWGAPVVVPLFGGRRGHPLVLAGWLLPELRQVRDESQGLRAVLLRHAGQVRELPLGDPRVLLGFNTPAEYQRARRGAGPLRPG